ncbi:NDP-sugar pyrophosphorylase family protein [Rhizobium sp. BK313]|uniref:nucleotidyltransferase family protein n=1 Tax=Rhizobium sp. BK313 TaxID=2587081 RepID=UPI00105F8E05|nr:nucleotidyltransferase family protein [Rhizobium sp. BK313]MBB3457301.1 NDP-sugar pyrophosphorylase family protein [Rhizobium sp. BK313]
MTLGVCILAGGLATRLRPITEKIPKSLVEVAGEPFIFHQLRYLREQNLTDVVLCVGYLGEMIEDLVGDGASFGLNVKYSPDGPRLLGTGGAVRQALSMLADSFFILYGDSFLPIDFSKVEAAFHATRKPGLMTVLDNGDRWDKSNVLFRDGQLIEYNKREPSPDMKYIDYGLGILQASALETYEPGEVFDIADLYHALSVRGQLAGYEVSERFYEIGSHSGLQEAEIYFREHRKQ